MKKKLAKISVLAVASMSFILGGITYDADTSGQASEAPVVVEKTVEKKSEEIKKPVKKQEVEDVAQVTSEEPKQEIETTVPAEAEEEEIIDIEAVAEVEEKAAKVESNQVVANIDSYLNIRADASEEAEVVGKFYTGNVGTIVEKGEEWSIVASGNAYGYVNNAYLLFGADAEAYIENNCDQVAKVKAETLNVRASESTESDIVTLAGEGSSLTVLGEEGGWFKVVAPDETVGYVSKDYVYLDYVYETAVTIEEEAAALAAAEAEAAAAEAAEQAAQAETQQTATEQQTATQQPAADNTNTEAPKTEQKKETKKEEPASVDVLQTDFSNSEGQAIADYAVQFVGNPYKYGGTSLTKGADCSGFVQTVFKNFGYTLPRTSSEQASAGKTVKTSNLQPGDLLFYHGYGHVAIYIGGGQVVHASNVATGIKISAYNYSSIDKAVRIVK